MEFTTSVPIAPGPRTITYQDALVALGSCFAEHMAGKFGYYQFRRTANPFGILFSPEALLKAVASAEQQTVYSHQDIFCHNGRWHSFDAHSSLSGDAEAVLVALQEAVQSLRTGISTASHILITLGTAWVYRDLVSGQRVANCHKLPAARFTKELMSVQQVKDCVSEMIDLVLRLNPAAQIVFTVSPVRHLKDGFVENQRSKSHLLAGLHEALDTRPQATYFPAYEIQMDQLRDYRFYSADMVHPSQTAIDFIWSRFSDTWIDPAAVPVMQAVERIRRGLAHRPFDASGAAHQRFLAELQGQIALLQKDHPHMDFAALLR